MKRTLTVLSIAVLASTAFAAVQAACHGDFERIPPTVEQVLSYR
jgi:hypothetical protein